MISFDKLKESAATLADGAVKVAGDLAQKGKKQVDQIALENKLAKAQRQLGALVYSLHKNGETNQELVNQYIQAVADVEAELATLAQLSDDSIVMLLRIRGGYLYRSRSVDGGLTWSDPEKTDIPNPGNKPKLIQDGKRIILLNTPSSGYGYQYRTPLAVWVSEDDMQTWKKYVVTDFAGWLSYPDGIAEGNIVRFAFELNRHDVYYAEAEID